MNIKLGMPEILVLASCFLYSQAFWFSSIAFSLGIISRTMDYLISYAVEQKKAEVAKEDLTDAVNAFKGIFSKDDSK